MAENPNDKTKTDDEAKTKAALETRAPVKAQERVKVRCFLPDADKAVEAVVTMRYKHDPDNVVDLELSGGKVIKGALRWHGQGDRPNGGHTYFVQG